MIREPPPQMPEFPVDDETLDLIAACLEPDGPSLMGVLDVLSGYDESKVVVSSLVAEVRRLRSAAASFAADARPAPTGHPARVVALSAAGGAVCGAIVGWHAAGRRG